MPINNPRGLVPIKHPNMDNVEVEYMRVDAGSGDIGFGTPLVELAGGTVQPASNTAGSQVIVGVSMEHWDDDDDPRFIAVASDPNQKFLVQSDTAMTQADIGSVASLEDCAVVSAEGLSGANLGAVTTGSARSMRVIGIHRREGNEFGAFQDVIVKPLFSKHQRGDADGV